MKKTGKKLLTLLLALVMVLGMLAVPALAADAIPYTGDKLNSIAADGSDFDTFEPMSGTSAYIIDNDVVIHYVLKDDTYKALHLGSITDADLNQDVVEFNDDNTFDLTVSTSNIQKAIPFAPIKADGSTTDTQYYLAIPAGLPVRTALEITNNTSMFKALTAYKEVDGEETFLVMALSGTGYPNLFKGTYEQAVSNGDNSANWIAGTTNSDGKLEFRIPLAAGETTIPLVAISNSYYTKYLNSENSLERAFYPRQAEIDLTANTLVTGDYSSSKAVSVTNNTTMFMVKATSQLEIVGGPNSNNYKASLALAMDSTSFDKAYVGRASAITDSTPLISIDENQVFELPVKWVATAGQPETLVNLMDAPFVVSFRSASKGTWSERQFTLSEADGTLVIDKAPEESGSGTIPGTTTSDFDNSTDLPDGTYTISAENYTFTNANHETPRSKLTCESVTVTDGKAVGTFSVSSEKMTHVYLDNTESSAENAALFDSSTGTMGANVYAISDQKVTIPVKLNAETPIAARTTAMSDPSWVNYLYTITVTADEPDEPETIEVLVTISDKGEFVTGTDGSVVALAPLTVTDLDNSGDITINEVFVAAHEEFYAGGANAGYHSYVSQYGLGVDMLWGVETTGVGYFVNNISSWSLEDLVNNGDRVQAFVYKDTDFWSDTYSYFDKFSTDTADGSVTLTLQGYYNFSTTPTPCAGAAITIDGEATSFVTDSDGKVTVSFKESGTHVVSAVGKDGEILVPPVCLVNATVTEPLTIDVLMTLSCKGELVTGTDDSVVALAPLTVTDLDNSGDITINEVFVAAHEEFYAGGANAGYHSYVSQYGLGVDMLWGVETTGVGYFVNNISSWSLEDLVNNGDRVQAFVYKDTDFWSDTYSYFDKFSTDTADGSVTLTLQGYYNFSTTPTPCAGAAITIDGEASSFVTDSEGKVTVSFNESGTHVVSAVGKDGEILVPPVCLVTVTLPEGEKDRLDLEITNNTSMFKAVTAYIETGDGASELVMALSGTGYHELFKGTYEKAVANGDNTAAWIHGYENSDGKWEFRIPLTEGESYIPLVAISNSYYTKYLAGENDLERAFFARELVIDWDAGTLETGDYSGETITVSVSSSVDTLQVAGSTQMTVVGGPNSNNFSVSFSLKVLDDTYDQLTYPTVVGSTLGTQTADLSGGAFEVEMINAPKKTAFENGVPFGMTLRDAETGETLPILVTIDVLAKTIDIEPGDEDASAGTGGTEGTTPAEDEAEAVTANVDVTAETEDGKATASVDAEAVTAALEEEAEAEILSVKVESENADTVELTLDADALKAVAEGGTALSVETEQGTLTLSKDELSKLAEDGGDVAVTLSLGEDGSMTLDVTVDGETADVTVKAALPAVEDSQVLVLVKEDGTEEVIRKSLVEDGTAYAYLPAGCTVKAVDNSKEFEDVGDSWYTDYVDFVSSHGLFIGVSETEFAPQDNMTRAMLVTVLFRLEDEPEGFTGLKFGDVKDESWYTDAVAWASETGIVTGTDRGFEPSANISREQIATILYRYVKYLGLDTEAKGDVTKFSDGSEVSSWASDAMTWAVGVGLFEGDGTGSLNPKGDATRAEVAALMIRLVKLLVK